jgi:succinate dehydrogenase/fumarate reductase flavoprotein subunit
MTADFTIEGIDTDIQILGAGGAVLCAALQAGDRSVRLSITAAVEGWLGCAGCAHMVHGSHNMVLTHGW